MKQTIKIYGTKTPYPWQSEAHGIISSWRNEEIKTARTLVIVAARQRFGKSAFVKAELLRFAFSDSGSINSYVSPDLNLARKMYKEIKRGAAALITASNGQTLEIEFINGSVIRFHSERQGEGLRGYTTTGILVIDEGSSFKDTTFYELISPWVTVNKALSVIISTPKAETGFFYDSYNLGKGENPYYLTIDWIEQYGPQCPISQEDLSKKPHMPISKWLTEYEGRFMKAHSAVFGDFAPCLINKGSSQYEELYLGLDFGGGNGGDYTVLVAFNERDEMEFTWACNNLSPINQIEELNKVLEPVKEKIKCLRAESNSIGITYIDMLRSKGYSVEKFVTTNQSKRKAVERFQVAIEQRKVRILNEPEIVSQLAFYERKVSNGLITYNAPAGMHDDYVIATVIAYSGRQQGNVIYGAIV